VEELRERLAETEEHLQQLKLEKKLIEKEKTVLVSEVE
jgi:hypothetical protein